MNWWDNTPPERLNRWLRIPEQKAPVWHLNHGPYFISLLDMGDRARPGRRWSYTLYRLCGEYGIAGLGSGYGDDQATVVAEALAALCRQPGAALGPATVPPLTGPTTEGVAAQ